MERSRWKYASCRTIRPCLKGDMNFTTQQSGISPATAELRLIVPKMKQNDFKLFNQWIYTGLKINPKEKTIFYTLHEERICFIGYFFEKHEKE